MLQKRISVARIPGNGVRIEYTPPGALTSLEIRDFALPLEEVPDLIRCLFGYLAAADEKACSKLFKELKPRRR